MQNVDLQSNILHDNLSNIQSWLWIADIAAQVPWTRLWRKEKIVHCDYLDSGNEEIIRYNRCTYTISHNYVELTLYIIGMAHFSVWEEALFFSAPDVSI